MRTRPRAGTRSLTQVLKGAVGTATAAGRSRIAGFPTLGTEHQGHQAGAGGRSYSRSSTSQAGHEDLGFQVEMQSAAH